MKASTNQMFERTTRGAQELTLGQIARTWWPLAASWLLMSLEGPAHSAVVARLADAENNLAAWGGIVFPISLVIEAPIVMLLAASTALSKDWESYTWLRRFMMWSCGILTALHALIAFTPLYDIVAREIIGAPEAIIDPGRIGLMIMLPWTWAIGFRRLQQGAMIRFGHSNAVGIGTVVRLGANALMLASGYWLNTRWNVAIPGIVVAAVAVASGVTSEAVYAGLRMRAIAQTQIRVAPRSAERLTMRSFLAFYIPLALTALMTLLVPPIGSMAISRMPNTLAALAAWPVVNGLIFMLRSPGIAYNEVVVALLNKRKSAVKLRRFSTLMAVSVTLAILLITATPLAELWFAQVMALPPELLAMSRTGLWLALPLPLLSVLQNWYQGALVNRKHTRAVTEAVTIYMAGTVGVLLAGIALQRFNGLYISVLAYGSASLLQVLWLWARSRSLLKKMAVNH